MAYGPNDGDRPIDGIFADVYVLQWVSHLRKALAAEALRLGMREIDQRSLERAQPRRLTQLASWQVYRLKYAGIFLNLVFG
jgi:hypothetical protein